VALRRLQADNDELAYDMTRRTIEVGDWERTGWQYRWLLINSSDRQKLRDALSNMDRLIERLEGWYRFIQGETLRAQRKGDDAGFAAPGTPSPEEAAVAAEYLAAQRTRAEIMRGAEQSVGNLLRTLGLWRQDVQWRDAERLPPTVVSDWWSATGHALTAIWTFELFAAEDNLEIDGQRVTAVRSVTVGKSLGVILLVLFGSLIGAQGIRIAKNLAVTHLRVHRNHADIIARWSHIVLLSMLVIIGLYLTNIPLTVFAFLGGALAIGVGFGTQVMLKNMISGIMLLVERPLRIGDIVEVGSVVGTVTNISIRSSTVRTSDGIEILVPNSTFIENNVTNWTYSNPRVRRMVTVGADYAAPPEKVAAVLRGVADRHPSVLKDPAPQVLLSEFGGDAAHFTLRYWIDYGAGADGSMIASDLRFMIAKALAEAGVAIPLPQRVIHLKTTAENSMPATEER
jgi:small-conductance mechanosensitive channel